MMSILLNLHPCKKRQQEASVVEYLSEECIITFLKHPSPFILPGWGFSDMHDWPVVFSFQGHLMETPVSLEMLWDTRERVTLIQHSISQQKKEGGKKSTKSLVYIPELVSHQLPFGGRIYARVLVWFYLFIRKRGRLTGTIEALSLSWTVF